MQSTNVPKISHHFRLRCTERADRVPTPTQLSTLIARTYFCPDATEKETWEGAVEWQGQQWRLVVAFAPGEPLAVTLIPMKQGWWRKVAGREAILGSLLLSVTSAAGA